MQLYILHNGIAKKSESLVTRAGKRSPLTIDLGFLNLWIRPATWKGRRSGMLRSNVLGMSSGSKGVNSELIALKWSARIAAVSYTHLTLPTIYSV